MNRIRKLRKVQNLTLEELGNIIGCTSQSIQSWETGRFYPAAENLFKLSKFFNVSIDYLLNNPVAYQGLTQEENDLLEIFNSLNDYGQDHMMLMARTIGATASYKKNYVAPNTTVVA